MANTRDRKAHYLIWAEPDGSVRPTLSSPEDGLGLGQSQKAATSVAIGDQGSSEGFRFQKTQLSVQDRVRLIASGARVAMDEQLVPIDAANGLPARPKAQETQTVTESKGISLRVSDASGRPIQGAELSLVATAERDDDAAVTGRCGRAVMRQSACTEPFSGSLTVAAQGYWDRTFDRPRLCPNDPAWPVTNEVVLSPIEGPAVDSPPWGIEAMNLHSAPQATLLGSQSPRVAIITLGYVGKSISRTIEDERPEDEHVPSTANAMFSAASEAMRKIIADCTSGVVVDQIELAHSSCISDLIKVFEDCPGRRVDLICLCVGVRSKNDALAEAIRRLGQRGTIIVSPAGACTESAPYPAIQSDVIGVGCLGRKGAVPVDCPHAPKTKAFSDDGFCSAQGNTASAGIDMLAPGIGICVDGFVVSGAVFAAAHVVGFAARLLQSDLSLARSPRSALRGLGLRAALQRSCVDLGLRAGAQGAGMPIWGGRANLPRLTARERQLERKALGILDAIGSGSL